MSLLVLVLLVALWSAVLLPDAFSSHRSSSPFSTVSAFQRAMSMLSTPGGAARPSRGGRVVVVPDRRTTAARRRTLARRRRVLQVLLAGLLVAGTAAVTIGGPFRWVLAADAAALIAYVALLRRLRTRVQEARRKITPLPRRDPAPAPAAGIDRPMPRAAGGAR